MRRLTVGLIVLLFLGWGAAVAAEGSDGTGAGGGAYGPDQDASGSILHGDPTVQARHAHYERTRERRGGGHVACRYWDDASSEEVNLGD